MPRLVMVNGEQAGKDFPLTAQDDIYLGRDEECEICIPNMPGISRKHARFRHLPDGWMVEDLGSQNGIYVNNMKVERRVLKDNEVMWFSNLALRFEFTAPSNDGEGSAVFNTRPSGMQNATATISESKAEAQARQAAQQVARTPTTAAHRSDIGADTALPPPAAQTMAGSQPRRAPEPSPATDASMGDVEISPDRIAAVGLAREAIIGEFSKVIVGQRDVLDELLIALISSGHCLMIGLPGLAKTLMISTLSEILDLRFKRIQFTPDLMPSDIIGSDVLDIDGESGNKSFRFIQGPVFTNMLLADEINRTPPKTQAALLEAMQERQVTAGNTRFVLPKPFFVLATQNPLEQEGTYPLPEAQLDRFMFNILVDYPSAEDEEEIVMATTRKRDTSVQKVLTGEQLLHLQDLVRELPVSRYVVRYATRLTRATRPAEQTAPDYIREHVSCGAGPRAAQFLVLGAKARAVLDGRLNVSCDDVRALAMPILRHRIFTNFTADSEGITADDLVQRLLLTVPEPAPDEH